MLVHILYEQYTNSLYLQLIYNRGNSYGGQFQPQRKNTKIIRKMIIINVNIFTIK